MALRQLPDVPSVIKVTCEFSMGTPCGGSSFYLRYGSTDNVDSSYESLAQWIGTTWGNDVAQQVSTHYELTTVTCQDLSTRTSPSGTAVVNQAGLATGNPLPVSNAVLVNYNIKRRYRGGKPRGYWPGGVDTDSTDGRTWTDTFVTAFQNAFSGWVGAIGNFTGNIGSLTFVSVGYFSGGDWHQKPNGAWEFIPAFASPTNVDLVVGHVVNKKIGTQRRRLTATS